MPNQTLVDDATLVHISVKQTAAGYVLEYFPMRVGDTTAFNTRPPEVRNAARPREVVWVGHDLPPNHRIKISAKVPIQNANQRLLPQNDYWIDAPDFLVHSGPVMLHGRANQGDRWGYSITLIDPAGAPVPGAFIDPEVIIQPDP